MKVTFRGGSYLLFSVAADDVKIESFSDENVLRATLRYTAGAARQVRDVLTKAIVLAEIAAMSEEELNEAIAARQKSHLNVVPFPKPREPVGHDADEDDPDPPYNT